MMGVAQIGRAQGLGGIVETERVLVLALLFRPDEV